MRESAVQGVLREEVRKAGGMSAKIGTESGRGVPDMLVLLPFNRIFLVELKADTGRLEPLQRLWHEKAAKIGVTVVRLRGSNEVRAWLAKMMH